MDALRNMTSRLRGIWVAIVQRTPEELARRSSTHPSRIPHDDRSPVQDADRVNRLREFRILLGIHQDASFAAPSGFKPNRRPVVSTLDRPAPNMGIYPVVFDNEIQAKRSYVVCSKLINSCLALQLIAAAALTALGASSGSHGAVTVLGAINTVIAGFLTYLKSSGLPNRLRYDQQEWGKLREYIEYRERDLICGHDDIDVNEEFEKIMIMYATTKSDIESNTPERFVSVNAVKRDQAPGLAVFPVKAQSIAQHQNPENKHVGAQHVEKRAGDYPRESKTQREANTSVVDRSRCFGQDWQGQMEAGTLYDNGSDLGPRPLGSDSRGKPSTRSKCEADDTNDLPTT